MTARSKLLVALAVATMAVPVAAQSVGHDKTSVEISPGKAVYTSKMKVEATVVKLNRKSREATLKTETGEDMTFTVGPEVKNLKQVKVGDKVIANYIESVSLTLIKDGKEAIGRHEENADAVARPGEKPAAGTMSRTVIIANVTKVDRKAGIVTLKGIEDSLDMHIKDPEQLKLVKVGDQVRAVVTQAIAVSVEPAAKTAK